MTKSKEILIIIAVFLLLGGVVFVLNRGKEKTVPGGSEVMQEKEIEVSLFIDPDEAQIEASVKAGAPVIEIHTGAYADAKSAVEQHRELQRIIKAAKFASKAGLIVNAGHGLNYQNVQAIAAIPEMNELNIGHGIVARAIFIGLEQAVREMKRLMIAARTSL